MSVLSFVRNEEDLKGQISPVQLLHPLAGCDAPERASLARVARGLFRSNFRVDFLNPHRRSPARPL